MAANKTPAKKPDKDNKPTERISEDYVKKLLQSMDIELKPSVVLKKATDLWNEFENASKQKQEQLKDAVNKKLEHALVTYALDNHYFMAELLNGDKYRTLLIEVNTQLVDEYDCKTASEKMTAQTAAWAFCSMMEYAYKLNYITRIEYTTAEKNAYFGLLSKQVDRSARIYFTAITTLRRLKQPDINVTFKANNAFVAQNQQINSKDNPNPKDKNNAGQ